DSFTYKANDGTTDSQNVAMVTLLVTPVNDAPTATPQSVSTAEDTALPMTLAGIEIGTAAGDVVYTITVPPAQGTMTGGTGPSRTYTPAPNYNGPDAFEFKVPDRGDPDNCGPPGPTCAAALQSAAAATVSIAVTPVNDAPTATAQSVSTAEDTALPITLAGT